MFPNQKSAKEVNHRVNVMLNHKTHPNILKKLAPLYDVSVHELMAAAGYLDEVSPLKYKCLNPDCGYDFEARGAGSLRCPYCGTGYVLDWDTFEEVVLAEANWLIDPIGYMASR